MYDFLHKYAPSYVSQDKNIRDKSQHSLNYVLTNKLQFRDLKERDQSNNVLMLKENV